MGLDAVVRCRCWEDNKVSSPPPYAEHVAVDDEDCLRLDLPWEDHAEAHDTFDRWMESCCPHPEMQFARERVSNWGGVRQFQDQLKELGIDQFPTLRDVLPAVNGGLVPSDRSRTALAELDDFAVRRFGSKIVLFDVETGESLHEYIAAYGGCFAFSPGNWEGGVDPLGFFVRGPKGFRAWLAKRSYRPGAPKRKVISTNSDGWIVTGESRDLGSRVRSWLTTFVEAGNKHEWFRSSSFLQEDTGEKRIRLTDEISGRRFVSPIGACKLVPWPDGRSQNDQGRVNSVYPPRVAVESRIREAGEFDYILRPLASVFRASVETGNPVQWR